MKSLFPAILICVFALLAGVYIQLFGFNLPIKNIDTENTHIEGFFWPEQKSLMDFDLVDQDQEKFDLARLTGQWNLMFFGYTHCPDICPTTMTLLQQVIQSLDQAQALTIEVQIPKVIFVSVDGERDTPFHLKTYINFFSKEFIGLSGSKEQVDSLTGQLGVPYSIEDHDPGAMDYLVGHSGAIFLISPQGNLASIFQPPYTQEEIITRLNNIFEFMSAKS